MSRRQGRHVTRWLWVICCFATIQACSCEDEITPGEDFIKPKTYGTYTPNRTPKLDAPDVVDFGKVSLNEQASRVIEVGNIGRLPLKVSKWSISEGFTVASPEALPNEIAPGQRLSVELVYVASTSSALEGALTIESNDPDRPTHKIDLRANVIRPCLLIEPAPTLDFGSVTPEQSKEMSLLVSNCSETVATTVSLDAASVEALDDTTWEVDAAQWTQTIEMQPGDAPRKLTVRFSPGEVKRYAGQLVFRSNATDADGRVIDLKGRGRPFDCPQPVITATNESRGVFTADPEGTYFGLPLDTVKLDSGASAAAAGARIERVEWSLIANPQDSGSLLTGAEGDRQTSLFLDLSGDYVVELNVWDSRGNKSCEPARLNLRATPDEDFHIQLVWSTPNDDQQFDEDGSDVDLHLLHPNGEWNEAPYDCFWQMIEPDWGEFGDKSDDPSLDIDDTNGWGPENINLNNPEIDTTYSVGVHYFADHGFGASFATVRFYLKGVLVKEYLKQRMINQQFWHVFDVTWPSGQVTSIDQVYSNFPNLLE